MIARKKRRKTMERKKERKTMIVRKKRRETMNGRKKGREMMIGRKIGRETTMTTPLKVIEGKNLPKAASEREKKVGKGVLHRPTAKSEETPSSIKAETQARTEGGIERDGTTNGRETETERGEKTETVAEIERLIESEIETEKIRKEIVELKGTLIETEMVDVILDTNRRMGPETPGVMTIAGEMIGG